MRPSSWMYLAMALALIASIPACTNCSRRDNAALTPIAEGESCEEDERCETGLCDSPVAGATKICLRTCTMGCRGSDVCTPLIPNRYACVPERAGLCKPCQTDADCPQAADRCLVLGASRFCGRDCSFDESCPPSYRCGEGTTVGGGFSPKQCQPSSGTCDCIAATAGQQKPCTVTNATGTCSGISVCRPPAGYDACSARTPTSEVCNGLDDDCNGQIDENLGDQSCGVGECQRAVATCANGSVQPCTPGLPASEACNGLDDNCNGTADEGFNLQTTVAHCGACNRACVLVNAIPKCELGACAIDRCVAGWTNLDGLASNGCEYPCTRSDGGMEVCDGLDNDCDGVVDENFDLANDPTNCGGCNLTCSLTGTTVATYACSARQCAVGTCAAGRGNCNQQYADGCEVSLNTNVLHCGMCGLGCTAMNGTPSCDGGACGIAQCNPGFSNCNGQLGDGCEANLQNSVSNCGMCGRVCSAQNATNSCVAGGCQFACAANWWDADGQANNGCEYACVRSNGGVEACDGIDNDCDNRVDEDFDFTTSSTHCGMCNRACTAPFASTACSASSCGISSCNTSRGNCNGLYVDGCEVNTGTDLAHCGGCNQQCTVANGTPRCTGGICGVLSCNAGSGNCNTLAADGCEVNTNSTLAHCGACNQLCTTPNGTPRCLAGICGVQSCNAGHSDCNSTASDGCEVDTGSDLNNCGGCNQLCAPPRANPRCTNGTCGVLTCQTGWTNCNGLASDGCEVNTGGSDLGNCGGCGTACTTPNATPRCASGVCSVLSCNLGFVNCNLAIADGCEVNTTNNVNNCGMCGFTCALPRAVAACTASACTIGSCVTGWINLNGVTSDGCEYNCSITNGGVETCGDFQDNDCDGLIDEGCP